MSCPSEKGQGGQNRNQMFWFHVECERVCVCFYHVSTKTSCANIPTNVNRVPVMRQALCWALGFRQGPKIDSVSAFAERQTQMEASAFQPELEHAALGV